MGIQNKFSNRWIVLGISSLISSCCGVNYAWGIYSETLKSRLQYSQATLITLSFWGNVGQFFTPPAGIVYDSVGGRGTLLLGLLLGTTGYTLMYLGVSGQIDVSFTALCSFYCLGSAMQSFYDTSSLFTNTKNFPIDVNSIIGFTKAWNGIGASLFSTAYIGYVQPDHLTFIKIIPIVSSIVGVVGLITLQIDTRVYSVDASVTSSFIKKLLSSQMVLVAAVAAFALVNANEDMSQGILSLVTTIIMIMLSCFVVLPAILNVGGVSDLFVNIEVASPHGCSVYTASRDCLSEDCNDETDALILPGSHIRPTNEGDDDVAGDVIEEECWYESLKTLDFWIIFIVVAIAAGSGLTVINNIAQILSSKDYKNGVSTGNTNSASFVALLSAANCAGRILVGYVCDKTGNKLSIVVIGFVLMLIIQAIAILILSSTGVSFAYLACVLSGLAYGSLWALVPTAARLLWSQKRFATNYNFISIATILGNYILSVKVTAGYYDCKLLPGEYICKEGETCFKVALRVVAIVCASATLLPPIILRNHKFRDSDRGQLTPPSPSQL